MIKYKYKMDREQVRKNIKADARNLCEYVVKTACEYKEELYNMEEDILKLEKKIHNSQNIIANLKEQNEILTDEYINMEYRLRRLIERLGSKLCYRCDHFLDCDQHLCVYCHQWFCSCCIRVCPEGDDEKYCGFLICADCLEKQEKCPTHNNIKDEKLIRYYLENRYKN